MRGGYGLKLLNIRKQPEKIKEFPVILRRVFPGVVVKTGCSARRFRAGNEVSNCVRSVTIETRYWM